MRAARVQCRGLLSVWVLYALASVAGFALWGLLGKLALGA